MSVCQIIEVAKVALLLDLSTRKQTNAKNSCQSVYHQPISVVLEGLDGIGKSTTAQALANRLDAVLLQTPPTEMLGFRPFFDKDLTIRKGFYMVGNFLVGDQISMLRAEGKTVVIDRYYASTIAYILGKSHDPLPPLDCGAYDWPAELNRPTHMFLITLPEEDRIIRRSSRTSIQETEEEAILRRNQAFSSKINEAYRRLGCKEIAISVNDDTETIVNRIMGELV
eukprot:gene9686-20134_t